MKPLDRRSVCSLACLCALSVTSLARADPPPPKVCVVVAGDPDEAVRTLAEQVTGAIAQHPSLRGVADADARAALRGEAPPGGATADIAELSVARRGLRGTSADLEVLRPVIDRLGCGLVLTLRARPSGVALRVVDGRDGRLVREDSLEALDAAAVVRLVTAAATPSSATDGGTASDGSATALNAPASASTATASAATTNATSTPNARRATAPAPRPSTWRRVWPWLAIGGVAAGVLISFLVAANPSPADTTLQVVHRGSP